MVEEVTMEALGLKHPNKNYTANKPFPAYERLKLVLSKNRATRNIAESATHSLKNTNMIIFQPKLMFLPFEVLPIQLLIPNEGEETSKKRKKTNEISKLVKETKNEIHEATNQMKRLVSVISDSITEMNDLSNELKRLGLGVMKIIRMDKYFGDKPSQYCFWKNLDDNMKLKFVKSIYDEDK
ncbi:hypothetical protein Ccrd_013811 [Cynara cardunculus var. scolymus]|uniref:Uncharacterized protein n=1 Tax=Cynara cardunculus var. scolymus TaxID=59895 RepID=A0A103YEW8_CYNCS|nr:hypothetical protein Ccrd_013811 [Cynara cardunculus var. scolymus]